MHPPFFVVDHKVGPHDHLPHHDRPAVRRSAPEPLRLGLPSLAEPHLRIGPPPPPEADAPAEAPAAKARGGIGGWLSRFRRAPQRRYA